MSPPGCAHAASTDQLLKRAAFDLDCAPEKLTVVEIDPRTRGVKGCGLRASYTEICEERAGANVGPGTGGSYRTNCTWMLNTDARGE